MPSVYSSLPFSIISTLILSASVIGLQFSNYQHFRSSTNHLENTGSWDENKSQQQITILRILPKFGYRNLFADWTFLNFLQYFGDSDLRQITGYSLNPDYFESIVDSDPYFIESYVFLVNSISMYAGQPQKSIDLMEKGLASMAPNAPKRSYFIWRHKGTDELLFVGDNQSAQKSYQTAAIWAEQSSDKDAPLVARLSYKTAQFLATDPNSKPAQIGAWSDVLLRATDDNIRQRAIEQIEALGGKILAEKDGQVTVRYKTNGE